MTLDWFRQTAYSVVDTRARVFPDQIALLIPGADPDDIAEVTYGELRAGIWERAGRLTAAGIRFGDHVGVWSENSLDWMETWLACSLLGAVTVSLNPRLTVPEVEFQIDTTDVQYVFVGRTLAERAAGLVDGDADVRVIGLFDDLGLEPLTTEEASFTPAPIDPQRVGLIQFTSGSTGMPKGAMAREGAVVCIGGCCSARWLLNPADRVYGVFSLAHNAGTVYTTMTAFTSGAALILPSKPWGEHGVDLLERTGATFLPVVDTIISDVLRDGRELPAIRLVGGGFDPPRARALVDALGVEVSNTFGQTEVTANITVGDLRDPIERRIEMIGLPHPGNMWRIVDEEGNELPAGTEGSIELNGWTKMKGYYGRPDEEQPFTADGWVKTGDLGRVDEDGYIAFLGRTKDVIRSGGENVSAYEIENMLERHPNIIQAAVVPVPDDRYGEVPYAFVIQSAEAGASDQELTAYCRSELASFKIPKYFENVSSFPLTGPNKVAKAKLREAAVSTVEGHQPAPSGGGS